MIRFNEEKEELLTPKWLFDKAKFIAISLPCAHRNKKFSNCFTRQRLLPITESRITLFRILARCNPYSIINIRYSI